MPAFVGLHIGDERLYQIGLVFERYGYRVVDLENQHLTILYIGDYKGVFLRNIVEALKNVVLCLPSTLTPIEISLLPQGKHTNVAVLVKEDAKLVEARRVIEKILVKNNIEIKDRYPFLPHITIARRRKAPNTRILKSIILMCRKMRKILPKFIVIRNVFLYETTREGYRRILELKAKWI